jgi:hypothetical protein
MNHTSQKTRDSLLGQVIKQDYSACLYHSPAITLKNLKKHTRILRKMRQAGITEEEINFMNDFDQADAVHVLKLTQAADQIEIRKLTGN